MPEVNYKHELLALLGSIVSGTEFDGIVLSGGVDSSLLAAVAAKMKQYTAVTMVYRGSGAEDRHYSSIVAKKLGMPHILSDFGLEEAAQAAREVVRIMRTFDHVALRNDITIYLALRRCSELGMSSVITGDGGDELFAGYDYMIKMEDDELSQYISALTERWTFSAPLLGKSIGIKVIQPYLDRRVVRLACALPPNWRVKRSGEVYGKWILRSLLEDLGLPMVAYRRKEPIEVGSGSAAISSLLLQEMGEEANAVEEEALDDGVVFWSKEQAYFYKLYKEHFGSLPRPKEGEPSCGCCGAPLEPKRIACRYCGFCNWR